MVVPLGGPGGPGGPQAAVPPPPELLRFEPVLKLVGGLYTAVVVFRLVAGDVSSALQEIFVLLAAFCMVTRGQECFMQCLMPFLIFSVMALIFDSASFIQVLFASYPGAGNLFSSSCPFDQDIKLTHSVTVTNGDKNLTVYINNVAASVSEALLPAGDYKAPVDACSSRWVFYNIANVCSVIVGLLASVVGWKMFKVMRDISAQGGGGDAPLMGGMPGMPGMMGGGGMPGAGGPGPGGPGMGGGGPGRPLGGAGGGQVGRQEMQNPAGQGGFQPFGGAGQSLAN